MLRVALLALIRFYRVAISPWTRPSCRFVPTCSRYAEEAVARHGGLRGGVLTLQRLLRCRPWGGSGYDRVPAVQPDRPATFLLHGESEDGPREPLGSRAE